MTATDERLATLGENVRQGRESQGLTLDAAALAAGVATATWWKVEHGQPARGLTYAGVETVLGWEHGSCRAFLKTGRVPKSVEGNASGTDEPTSEHKLRLVIAVAERDDPDIDWGGEPRRLLVLGLAYEALGRERRVDPAKLQPLLRAEDWAGLKKLFASDATNPAKRALG